MAHGYRNLQHWNQWLHHQFLGEQLLASEQAQFAHLLERHLGKHAGLIGVPHQSSLLNATQMPCHSLLSPLISKDHKAGYVEGDFHDLPVLTGSMDLILLPHTLEFIDHPRQLLAEACRIVKPEGLIVISGFNPYSSWGLSRKFGGKSGTLPPAGNKLLASTVINWLKLADFALEEQSALLFAPPINRPNLFNKLQFLEKIGSKWFPVLGGVYIIVARAKVIPLTPIRLKWKQQLGSIRITPPLPGNIA